MSNLYQHFRTEEREFIDQVLSWRQTVEQTYAPKLTDFLDPREQDILHTIIGSQSDVRVQFDGGHRNAERKRALIFPDYFIPEMDDFRLELYQVNYPHKFVLIEHPQVLGSLMSLGLKRSKFGDILFEGHTIQVIVSKEVSSYISMQLESVGKASVQLEEKPFACVIDAKEQWQEKVFTMSSLRLDTLIASIYNFSRQKAQQLISGKKVKVNWAMKENVAFDCRESDTISVRGYGRCKVIAIEGKTKKEKWKVVVGIQK